MILLAHLGENYVTEEWSSLVVAANTSDIDAIIDGHSHEVTPSLVVKNKEGWDVPITQTGTKLANIGKLTITDGGITTELIGSVPAPSENIPADTWTVIAGRGGRKDDSFPDFAIKAFSARLHNICENFGQCSAWRSCSIFCLRCQTYPQ